jgi:plastocyanin
VRPWPSLALLVVALSLGFTAVSSEATSAVTGANVSIVFRSYQPSATIVNVGETVTWSNQAFDTHTVTALNGSFGSSVLSPHESFSVTFSTAGTYRYMCVIHPTMKGTVIVRSGQVPQLVQVRLSKRRGSHGRGVLVHVESPRPEAEVLLEQHRKGTWRSVAEARSNELGAATLSVSSPATRQLRVVVLGGPGEQVLISQVLSSGA